MLEPICLAAPMDVFYEKRISSTPIDKSLPSYPAMPSTEAFEKAK
ncbi:hypothetical protein N9363_08795 [Paracoccaceae bacterium]|nr:hypothetical protein [Paracoccaceae bacterium]